MAGLASSPKHLYLLVEHVPLACHDDDLQAERQMHVANQVASRASWLTCSSGTSKVKDLKRRVAHVRY